LTSSRFLITSDLNCQNCIFTYIVVSNYKQENWFKVIKKSILKTIYTLLCCTSFHKVYISTQIGDRNSRRQKLWLKKSGRYLEWGRRDNCFRTCVYGTQRNYVFIRNHGRHWFP